mgnify:CR=1 FL=1
MKLFITKQNSKMNAEYEKEQGNKNVYNILIRLAVFYEQDKIKECIEECEKAIKIGNEEKADPSAIAK